MADQEPDREENDEMLSTREWLARKRKADYQKAKQRAKDERDLRKFEERENREKEQVDRDQTLWNTLKKGNDLIT